MNARQTTAWLLCCVITGSLMEVAPTMAQDRAVPESPAIRFTYDPKTGLLTWESMQERPTCEITLLVIKSSKPLGFPKDAPQWGKVNFLEDHVELYAEEPSALSSLNGVQPAPAGKPAPILVYESDLTREHLKSVTYATADIWLMLAIPTYVSGPDITETEVEFLKAP